MRSVASSVILCVLIPLVLGSCAETQLAIHAAKRLSGNNAGQGAYKVGNPYQINGIWYYPAVDYNYSETGVASWYGTKFHGRSTANGEIFDMNTVSAAHRTLPLPSIVRVVNLRNGRAILVRVNDRGPYARGRIIDLSRRSAQLLGFQKQGTAPVRVEIMAQESRRIAHLGRQGKTAAILGAGRLDDSVQVVRIDGSGTRRKTAENGSQIASAVAKRPSAKRTQSVSQQRVKPARYFVQAGAFVYRDLARRMMRKLSPVGPTRLVVARVGNQTFYRVRVGPVFRVKDSDRILNDVIAYGYPDARIVID